MLPKIWEPKIWGPGLWKSIHYISLGYPDNPTDNDKNNYYNFYINLWKIIPCLSCSNNYKRHLLELPIDSYLQSRNTLFEWTIKLHNIVNKELGKEYISIDKAINIYSRDINNNKNKLNSLIFILILIIIFLILLNIFLIFYKK